MNSNKQEQEDPLKVLVDKVDLEALEALKDFLKVVVAEASHLVICLNNLNNSLEVEEALEAVQGKHNKLKDLILL